MRVIQKEDLRDLRKNRQILSKETAPEKKPEPKNELIETLKRLTAAMELAIARPAPQVTVEAPVVNVDIPKPANKWKFKVGRNNSGFISDIIAERLE
jgi:hypothetical protein